MIGLLIVVGISMFIPRIREYHEYQRTAAQLAEETRHEEEMIKHLKMQQERSQALNRFLARRRLADKLEHRTGERQEEEEKARERIRRNKARAKRRVRKRLAASKGDSDAG